MRASVVLAVWHPELLAPLVGTVAAAVTAFIGVLAYRRNAGQRRSDRRDRRRRERASADSTLPPPFGLLDTTVHGRGALVDDLCRIWDRRSTPEVPRLQVLHGTGGVGKTTVALLTARRAIERGVCVWWVSAATRLELHTGLQALTRHLGASDSEVRDAWQRPEQSPPGAPVSAEPTAVAADLLWRLLRTYREPWLLIIDNADDLRVLTLASETVPTTGTGWLRPGLPHSGAILLTTRTRDARVWSGLDWCRTVPVGMLSARDGAALLQELTGGQADSDADADQLSEHLQGLPLALRLAGRYLAATKRVQIGPAITTYQDYLAELGKHGPVPLMSAFEGVDPPPDRHAIDRTWQLSLALLHDRGQPGAAPLLRVLAVMADGPIPYPLVLEPKLLRSTQAFRGCDLRELLLALDSLGLIDFVPLCRLRHKGTYADLMVMPMEPSQKSRPAREREAPGPLRRRVSRATRRRCQRRGIVGVGWRADRGRSVRLFGAGAATATKGIHLAFVAEIWAAVDAFYAAAVAAGDEHLHAPRFWSGYRAYCAFMSDPDGNNI